jgi:hypothetical protein
VRAPRLEAGVAFVPVVSFAMGLKHRATARYRAEVCIELRNRYVLGYVPPDSPHEGRYHHIEMEPVLPRGLSKLKAHCRTGYYAPTE